MIHPPDYDLGNGPTLTGHAVTVLRFLAYHRRHTLHLFSTVITDLQVRKKLLSCALFNRTPVGANRMESLGNLVRDLIRQFLAFAFPGSLLVFAAIQVCTCRDSVLPVIREYWLFSALFGYGLSVAVGFSLHSLSVLLLHRKSGQDFRSSFKWIGTREAEFQVRAGENARHHHRRLVAYWQMCSPFVLASLFSAILVTVSWLGNQTATAIVAAVIGAIILVSLVFGHFFMHLLVEAYEERVIELGATGDAENK